mgnify:CR=1 FL=1
MNVTATLFGQMITFAILIWFVMQFLWGPMTRMLEARQKRIADGLAAAEAGQAEKEQAEERARELVQAARVEANEIIAKANRRATEIVEDAKESAKQEGDRIRASAAAEKDQVINQAREHLRQDFGALTIAGVEKILKREVDAKAHNDVIDDLVKQL